MTSNQTFIHFHLYDPQLPCLSYQLVRNECDVIPFRSLSFPEYACMHKIHTRDSDKTHVSQAIVNQLSQLLENVTNIEVSEVSLS